MGKHNTHLNAESRSGMRVFLVLLSATGAMLAAPHAGANDLRVDGVLEQAIEIDGAISTSQRGSPRAFAAQNFVGATGSVRIGSTGSIGQYITAEKFTLEQRQSAGAIAIGNGVVAGLPNFALTN